MIKYNILLISKYILNWSYTIKKLNREIFYSFLLFHFIPSVVPLLRKWRKTTALLFSTFVHEKKKNPQQHELFSLFRYDKQWFKVKIIVSFLHAVVKWTIENRFHSVFWVSQQGLQGYSVNCAVCFLVENGGCCEFWFHSVTIKEKRDDIL